MPRYYCDYCDAYLTHDSASVRKQHNIGFKHKANVRAYYAMLKRVADGDDTKKNGGDVNTNTKSSSGQDAEATMMAPGAQRQQRDQFGQGSGGFMQRGYGDGGGGGQSQMMMMQQHGGPPTPGAYPFHQQQRHPPQMMMPPRQMMPQPPPRPGGFPPPTHAPHPGS